MILDDTVGWLLKLTWIEVSMILTVIEWLLSFCNDKWSAAAIVHDCA
jgi:hypothetical protein